MISIDFQSHIGIFVSQLVFLLFQLALSSVAENDGPQSVV
jgi:hypothetical protein